MAQYELTFLLNAEEDAKKIKEYLTLLSAEKLTEHTWGKKMLAYPIKKKDSAYFFNWIFELPQNKLMEFRKKLAFNEQLVRYLLLKVE